MASVIVLPHFLVQQLLTTACGARVLYLQARSVLQLEITHALVLPLPRYAACTCVAELASGQSIRYNMSLVRRSS